MTTLQITRSSDVLPEEEVAALGPILDDIERLNERLGAGTYEDIAAGTNSVVGTDTIKVGAIYRPARVTPLGAPDEKIRRVGQSVAAASLPVIE